MTTNIPQEYRPLLALLAHSVVLRNETKAAIIDMDADAADSQQKLNSVEHQVTSAQQFGSVTKRWFANATKEMHADRVACFGLARQLLEEHLQTIDRHYLELESDLKAKILEVSGGDTSLFATYIPARPDGFHQA